MNNNKNVAFKRLPANLVGRDFIVSDVHGYFSLLENLLSMVKFDPAIDRLFIAGDLVDRGPESIRALEWLEKGWVNSVMGNHDYWHLHHDKPMFRDLSEAHGGMWRSRISAPHRDAFIKAVSRLPVAIEVSGRDGQRWGIVHAECAASSWGELVDYLTGKIVLSEPELEDFKQLCMHKFEKIMKANDSIIPGIDELFVGHFSVDDVCYVGNVLYIDTGVYKKTGRLTLLDMHTKERWMAYAY